MATKVLVIDDESLILMSTEMVLESEGMEVLTAASGEEGLAKAASEKPDVVLLDIMMPGMDGWEVLRRLKESAETAGIPVVVFTAKENIRGRQQSIEMGAADYFRKPFEPDDLVELVRRVTGAGEK